MTNVFYMFLNRRISGKISELHPIAVKYLSDDVEENDDEAIAERLKVIRNYTLLYKHFEADEKRLYMINRNYLNFLKAIIFLYRTSDISIRSGVSTVPAEVYHTINAVQESFKDSIQSLSLK